ncbi:MAG: integration host factor subunit beta [Deltaproteobacteria bacterium]|nr:integration host factor subunit beta [Deltaproteobacteria bacterium]
MNKSELIAALSTADGVSEKKAAQVLDLILDEMTEALRCGERVEIRGFGSLIVKDYPAYQGRNPRSRETITVAGKRLPHFKVGKELRARINGEWTAKDSVSPALDSPRSATSASIATGWTSEPPDTD